RAPSARAGLRRCLRMRRLDIQTHNIELCTLREQLEIPQQGLRSDPRRHGVRFPQRNSRFGRCRARGDEGLGLPPVAVRGQRRALELLPPSRCLPPPLGCRPASSALVLPLPPPAPAPPPRPPPPRPPARPARAPPEP